MFNVEREAFMRLIPSIAAAGVAVVLLTAGATTATAAPVLETPTPSPSATETFSSTQPMVIKGFDAKVAAANGYKIVTATDGSQTSVPVTAAAKTEAAKAEAARANAAESIQGSAQSSSAAATSVVGNCGTSDLSGRKGYGDTVYFKTGFVVYGAVYEMDWKVTATGFISGNSWRTHRAGPTSGIYNAEGAIGGVVGPGIAGVPRNSASAAAIMKSGAVCYSQGPTFGFD